MILVILFSVGAAFATRPAKLQSGLYYWNGSTYVEAGTMGVSYYCQTLASWVCVYTYSQGVYTPYLINAEYTPIGIDGKPKPPVKKSN